MNQIIMILLISAIILVHEVGHFIAARMCGIRVTRFGIGMPIGPSWKLFKLGDTVFYLHAFLFGGYVSFADPKEDEPKEELSEDKDNKLSLDKKNKKETLDEDEYLPADSPELYENKTIGQKLFVVSAGVLMNVIFAVALVMFCAAYYHKLPTSNQDLFVAGFTQQQTSNISTKGILKGDKILKINNQKINSFYQLRFFAQYSKLFDDYAQKDLYEKNLSELKKLNPQITDVVKENQLVVLPFSSNEYPEKPLEVNKNVLRGLEKYKKDGIELSKTQIELRDKIYGKKEYRNVNPESFTKLPQYTLEDFALALSDTYKPMTITVLRDDKELAFNDVIISDSKDGLLGVELGLVDIYQETKTLKQIVVKSFDYLYTTTTTMLFSLWQLISGKVSASDMHGVIAIVKVGGDIIGAKGMLNGILLTAMISINLAIMNFLPIPALDGGHVLFLIIEKITGKKPSRELGEKINNFFFILLIILMIAICYNDIFALITKKL